MTFYLFSDGFQDQFGGAQGRKFRRKNFRDLLFQIHQQSFDTQKNELSNALDNWMQQKYAQLDDILVVGFRV